MSFEKIAHALFQAIATAWDKVYFCITACRGQQAHPERGPRCLGDSTVCADRSNTACNTESKQETVVILNLLLRFGSCCGILLSSSNSRTFGMANARAQCKKLAELGHWVENVTSVLGHCGLLWSMVANSLHGSPKQLCNYLPRTLCPLNHATLRASLHAEFYFGQRAR